MLKYNEEKIMKKVRLEAICGSQKLMKKMNKIMRKLDTKNMSKEEREEELEFVKKRFKEITDLVQRNLDL